MAPVPLRNFPEVQDVHQQIDSLISGLRQEIDCLLSNNANNANNANDASEDLGHEVDLIEDEVDLIEDEVSIQNESDFLPNLIDLGYRPITFSTLNAWDAELYVGVRVEQNGRSHEPWYVGFTYADDVEAGFLTNLYETGAVVRKEVGTYGRVLIYLSYMEFDRYGDDHLIRHYKILQYQNNDFADSNEFESISKNGYFYIKESPVANEYFLCLSHLVQTYSSPPRVTTSWLFSEKNLLNHLEIENGTFGDVYFGIWMKPRPTPRQRQRPTGTHRPRRRSRSTHEYVNVAIKKGKALDMPRGEFLNHIRLLTTLSHPNIVTFYGMRTQMGLCLFVQEFLQSRSLKGFLTVHRLNRTNLDLQIFIEIISQVSEGLEYLECRGIFYRNLSVWNILIMNGLNCKISDFGFDKIQRLKTDEGGNLVSAEQYLPWRNDVVAFGILIYDIFTYAYKAGTAYEWALMDVPDESLFPARPASCPWEIFMIVVDCWKFDASQQSRPYFSNLKTLFRSY